MTHTPGPWAVDITDEGELWVRILQHDLFIGDLEDTCGECHANAQLIAAAPDLLAVAIMVAATQCGVGVW